MGHYFINEDLEHNKKIIKVIIKNEDFSFITDNGVFSKNNIDYGSKLLIETYLKENDINEKRVLDVGCGYGFLGIMVSRVTDSYVEMIDINKRAVHLTNMNIKRYKDFKGKTYVSNVYENVEGKYDIIITNPPIRIGKEKLLEILIGAFDHLEDNGLLYYVIRKDQGALSIKKILEENGINVEVINKDKGYFIYRAKKC